ncbi:MAG TPA: phosphatase PAP2 family protein [Pirellulaceae bacterium]|jgi:membrane-associated phospholipid phosphatase|nr:phosphatase PAP2 family protein [Pirellulaceae bacterium]
MADDHLDDFRRTRGLPRRLLLLAIACFALGTMAFLADLAVVGWFPKGDAKSPFPGDVRRIVRLAEAYAHGSGILLVGTAILVADRRRVSPVLAGWAFSFGAGALANVVKLVIARKRPLALEGAETIWQTFLGPGMALGWAESDLAGHPIQSFPSGHAAAAAGWTVALALMFPRAKWIFVLLAALACAQRIECGAHYLSDVLFGSGIGLGFAGLLLTLPVFRRAFVGGTGERT